MAQSIGGGGGLGILTESTAGVGGSAAITMVLGGENSSHGVSSTVTIAPDELTDTEASEVFEGALPPIVAKTVKLPLLRPTVVMSIKPPPPID